MYVPEGNFRHILLFHFRNGQNAELAHLKLHDIYGDECLTSLGIGLHVFVPEIFMLKVNIAIIGQSS